MKVMDLMGLIPGSLPPTAAVGLDHSVPISTHKTTTLHCECESDDFLFQ
jgi:hypothetical protein